MMGKTQRKEQHNLTQTRTLKLVQGAMLAALVFVSTYIIRIPSPANGYVNLGDCFVLISGWLLGPLYGALAGGIGSSLTDLLSGYAHYVPGTFIIKGLMAYSAAIIYRSFEKNSLSLWFSGLIAECIMVVGYFFYAFLLPGKGIAAAASIPGNIVQGIVGIVSAVALMQVIKKNNILLKL